MREEALWAASSNEPFVSSAISHTPLKLVHRLQFAIASLLRFHVGVNVKLIFREVFMFPAAGAVCVIVIALTSHTTNKTTTAEKTDKNTNLDFVIPSFLLI